MTLAGELVLTRNQLLQTHTNKDETGIENAISSVNLITSELQEAIMATRMQPIGTVFTKFQRVVRDLSSQLGKKVELIIETDCCWTLSATPEVTVGLELLARSFKRPLSRQKLLDQIKGGRPAASDDEITQL